MAAHPALSRSIGSEVELWIKDETGNVSGSHKARHLMGAMLYLRVLNAAGLAAGEGIGARRLAIASCGNAAMAAAVIARAAEWPLDVFIPSDASLAVVNRLKELGARISVCERNPSEMGDPCFLRFREAIDAGAIPFGVQGPENGLAIEGGRTLAFEMAEKFRSTQGVPDAVFVQVGGGALASALAQGFDIAERIGLISRAPRLCVVQATGCAPLDRAWQRLAGVELSDAAHQRSCFMWPWEIPPVSVAHGILDDETYDWFEIAKFMRLTDGRSLVVNEDALICAHERASRHTPIPVSATGSAGLAGLLAAPFKGRAAVIFSGVER